MSSFKYTKEFYNMWVKNNALKEQEETSKKEVKPTPTNDKK